MKLFVAALIIIGMVLLIAGLWGCAAIYDSDRNMSAMSADQLRSELAE